MQATIEITESELRRLLVICLLSLFLLSCAITDAVQKVAEPIDRGGCRFDCGRAGLGFSRYVYRTHTCWCFDADGNKLKLYGIE